jgi:hypothetical protein
VQGILCVDKRLYRVWPPKYEQAQLHAPSQLKSQFLLAGREPMLRTAETSPLCDIKLLLLTY